MIAVPMAPGLFYVEWTGVMPKLRRHGIMGQFLRRVEAFATKTKQHKVYFYTSLKNIPAAKAYLKYGYEIEGVLANHFGGNDFLIFAKSLSRRRFSKKYQSQPDFKIELEEDKN
jgi:RimJ/RimL family protein N-acetyltransferase